MKKVTLYTWFNTVQFKYVSGSGDTFTFATTNKGTAIVFATANDEISISIQGDALEYICLDKSTAIKFSKILRTEINKIES